MSLTFGILVSICVKWTKNIVGAFLMANRRIFQDVERCAANLLFYLCLISYINFSCSVEVSSYDLLIEVMSMLEQRGNHFLPNEQFTFQMVSVNNQGTVLS